MRRPPFSRRHLDTRALLDYLDDRLDAAGRRRIEDHLASACEACRDRLREIGRLVEATGGKVPGPVPEAVRARALAVFDSRPVPIPTPGPAWTLATLVFDSLADPLPAMVRRAVGDARWLRYSLGEHPLEVEAELGAQGSWTLRGRVGLPEPALCRIEVSVGSESLAAWPDADGRFAFESVPAGEFTIEVRGPQRQFRLPSLTL